MLEVAQIPLESLAEAVETARPPADGKRRTCPSCSRPMTRFSLKGVELDLCSECGTTAFEPGELNRLTGGLFGRPVEGPKRGVFEMLWDCEHCDTKNLLGKTNRYCPVCGAPQDPKRRRFPEPGQEVSVNTEYDGADASCPACSTANGAKAKHCRHCGSPMDGSAKVALKADQLNGRSVEAPKPATPEVKKRALWPFVLAAVAVLFCGFCGVSMFWTKASTATVSGHHWARSIDIETFGPVNESAWCDSMPSGAYSVSRSKKQRSTNKVPNGETCNTRNVDRGDGTFERKQECTPKYRDEPVYDEHCDFKVDRWQKSRSLDATGSLADAPSWPSVSGLRDGHERAGARHETYTVKLSGPKREDWSCDVSQAAWQALPEGKQVNVQVRVVTGGVDCSSLK